MEPAGSVPFRSIRKPVSKGVPIRFTITRVSPSDAAVKSLAPLAFISDARAPAIVSSESTSVGVPPISNVPPTITLCEAPSIVTVQVSPTIGVPESTTTVVDALDSWISADGPLLSDVRPNAVSKARPSVFTMIIELPDAEAWKSAVASMAVAMAPAI